MLRTETAVNLHWSANAWAPAARPASYDRSDVCCCSARYALCSAEVSKPSAVAVTTSVQAGLKSQLLLGVNS